ncbi:MAG: substrate-binding periplasmic protein [Desulfococcaceae bacterium]
MKSCKFFFVLAAVLVSVSQAAWAESVKMGYFMLPPHQYTDNADDPHAAAKPKGASITYFEALASKMGYKIEWAGPLPLLRLSEYLKSGKVDGTLGFNKNPELESFFHYTDSPMYLAQPTLIVRKDNPLTQIRSAGDIRGWRIGLTVSIADRYTPLIDEHRDMFKLETLGGESWIKQNIMKLLANRIDAFFDRQPYTPLFVAAALQLDDRIKALPVPDPPTPMYIVFSKASKQGQKLLDQCNAVMPQMNLNYGELVQKEMDAASQPK